MVPDLQTGEGEKTEGKRKLFFKKRKKLTFGGLKKE
jgi:hypothetical protein